VNIFLKRQKKRERERKKKRKEIQVVPGTDIAQGQPEHPRHFQGCHCHKVSKHLKILLCHTEGQKSGVDRCFPLEEHTDFVWCDYTVKVLITVMALSLVNDLDFANVSVRWVESMQVG
jgi:hypothetical protein